jgi:DNA-binding SARP family transcriptional activator/energy-coupling factor transporter ATP-binding protein EcfA2
MRVGVLGPLQVEVTGHPVDVGGPRPRRLLAALVAHVGETVSTDALVDAVWGDRPPRSAVKTLQAYVTRLRAALGTGGADGKSDSDVIQTVAPGYRLALPREAVDANAFMALVRRARLALDDGAPQVAERLLVEAFELWRGEPYGEFADGGLFAAEVQRLTETRLAGLEVRLAAGLALGRDADVVADAQALCAAHPWHEQFWVHLVTALYRCGRQADALAALRRVRDLLAEEIGTDPGAELRALEQQVLRQDPTLANPVHLAASTPLPPELDPAGRPFFGRAEELAWLHEAWTDVSDGARSRLLVIAGPPGSGRTRLLAEFAARLHARGVGVHYGRVQAGLAVLDDLDEQSVRPIFAGLPAGPVLCVATYDPATATIGLRRALLSIAHDERVLVPLDGADIARLAARVAGPLDADLEAEIVSAAHGWPGEAERLAAHVIEERSARRVAAAVERARPASRILATAREEVASGVRDLARVRARTRQVDGAAGIDRVACPYKGLARYEQSDAWLFHGREELVARLCARLVDTPFVAVVGPSGAGKSSLVRAGLLPALAAGVLPGLADAPQHLLTPGSPLPAVDGPAIVVVDQFEEIFATITDDTARERYLDGLTALASRSDTRTVVVLRGDFVGACAVHIRLAQLLGDGTVLVGPMRPEEIRRAVELPARQVGLYPEPALVDAIVSGMRDAPGALPLMSTALVEVWQGRSGDVLTSAAYHRAGGVPGALARLGEVALASLDEPAREAARGILLRLADTGEGDALVRRRVPRRELGDDPATARALDELVNRRLLTASEAGVEVTHEALLTHWPRLAGWLAEDEQGRALRRHLAPAAAEWDTTGRPDAELYRGARLASALDWIGDRFAELTKVERDFLTASRDYADRELAEETARADRQTRAQRRLVAALAAAVSLLLVAAGATWLAINGARAAQSATRLAQFTSVSAQADRFGATDPSLAAQLDLVAYRMRPTPQRYTTLLSTENAALSSTLTGHTGQVFSVAFSPNGHTLASGGIDTAIRLWNVTDPAHPTTLGQAATNPTQFARPVAFSPDGRTLASGSADGTVRLWDVTDPAHPTALGPAWKAHPDIATTVVFSPDGRTLATGSADGTIRLWNLTEPGHPIPLGSLIGHTWIVWALAFSPDGRTLASGSWDGTARLWNVTDPAHPTALGQPLTAHTDSVRAVAFSRDGHTLATGSTDTTIRLWNVTGPAHPTSLGPPLIGHTSWVNSVAFSPDGHAPRQRQLGRHDPAMERHRPGPPHHSREPAHR